MLYLLDLFKIFDQISGILKENKPAVNVGRINKGSDCVVLLSFADQIMIIRVKMIEMIMRRRIILMTQDTVCTC